jgi:TPR repeat protein
LNKKMKRVFLVAMTALLLHAGIVCAGQLGDGDIAFARRDYATAKRLFLSAAAQGNADAQYNLGVMYMLGKGVTQNYAEAVKWYRLAAANGHAHAPAFLGVAYRTGQGVTQNYAEAVKWYRVAAANGYESAQLGLGVMYSEGKGVAQDHVIAHMWSNVAAAQGDAGAAKYRDKLAILMTTQQVAKAQEMALDCRASNYKDCM